MSRENLQRLLGEYACPRNDAAEEVVLMRDYAGNVSLARGPAVPTDGAKGYAFACIYQHSDGTNQTNALYCNIGSASAANFNLITVASD